MKKLYATMVMALVAMTASAQQTTDSTYVRIDFNLNPWNLPVSIPNRDKGENKNWSLVEDETGCFQNTHVFDWEVSEGETIQLELTPSNWKLTDYMNAMVYTHDLNTEGEPMLTMLWMRRGSQLTLKASKSYWFAKVAFDYYRNWASGSLYSGEATGGLFVWGKDSLQNKVWAATGELLPCWSGDSVQWSLPECTGNTYLKYIDVWLLPREGVQTAIDELPAATLPEQDYLFDLQGRRLKAVPHKGVYFAGRRKIVK